MRHGVLGTRIARDGVAQSVATCPTDGTSVVQFTICNRGNETMQAEAAITDTANSLDDSVFFIEPGSFIAGKGALVRTSVIIPSGSFLTVRATGGDASVVVTGTSDGEELETVPNFPQL